MLADPDPIGGGGARHVAVDADPVDRAHRALLLVLLGGGKVGCCLGEKELGEVDSVAQLNQLFAQFLTAVRSRSG
jgi:hypothetical protein